MQKLFPNRLIPCRWNLVPRTAAALCAVAITLPAHAQSLNLTGNQTYTANDATYQSGSIFVNNTARLNVVNNGLIEEVNGNDSSTINVSGGSVFLLNSYDISTVNISGGFVRFANGFNTGITNISGGQVSNLSGSDTQTVNISGGTVGNSYIFENSIFHVSGGALTNGILLDVTTARVNVIGAGLSFAHTGYGSGNPYSTNADSFQISGTIGGAARIYNLYVRNTTGAPNSVARQFLFNGAAPVNPVVVPEAGTLAMVAVGASLFGVVKRRK